MPKTNPDFEQRILPENNSTVSDLMSDGNLRTSSESYTWWASLKKR